MHRRLSRALTMLREHGSLSYAKMATIGGFCDLYCIIIKATSPNNSPLSDRYVNQLLQIFSISPSSSFRSFSLGFSRRFMKTRCWRVALKCLILLHHLLRSLPKNSLFRGEIIWARAKGLLCLNPCVFVDLSSSSFPEDYSMFIRSYASLLDEALDCNSIYVEGTEEEQGEEKIAPETLEERNKQFGRVIEVLPQLQNVVDRVLDCQPTPFAIPNNLVKSALRLIVRDSFTWYTCYHRELAMVLDNLLQLPYRTCISAFNIYKKAVLQTKQLSEFYNWCNCMEGIYGEVCEYPSIDRIPEIQVVAIEKLLNGRWEFSQSPYSPSTTSPTLTNSSLCMSLLEDGSDQNKVARSRTIISNVWEKFEDEEAPIKEVKKGEEMEPLILFDDMGDHNTNWEQILEASLRPRNYQLGHGGYYQLLHL